MEQPNCFNINKKNLYLCENYFLKYIFMTLQQLEYIVALSKTKHFVHAAEMCGVTQPTLSMMIQKLEDELDVKIFDRSKHPIAITAIGLKIIEQATRLSWNRLNYSWQRFRHGRWRLCPGHVQRRNG